ncbi:MAG: LicD family protein [Treponema sp.]|nr:LicD family protein [Treponema sp.]
MEKKLDLKEIKEAELAILIEFDKFCKKNNLNYSIAYGTLLGAIRHKGFIPWDDDIDVLMPRPDYERFLELTAFNPITPTIETCGFFPCKTQVDYPFIKLIDMTTRVKETGRPKQFMGIWIDIFPMDGIPSDLKSQTKIMKKIFVLRRWFCSCSQDFSASKNVLTFLKRLLPKLALSIYGIKRLCKKMDDYSKTRIPYEEASVVAHTIWGADGVRECLPKEGFEKTVDVEFEGHKFPAPSCWKENLTNLFGDYMQLPPEEKRVLHVFEAFKTI